MNLIFKLKNAKKVLNLAAHESNLLVELDEAGTRAIHAALLEIYHDIRRACEKHGIPVILCGGSALGAVRHHGFIPWDDDMDLSMSRRDYERFCGIFEQELGEKYLLNAPNYCRNAKNRYPRVLKKDSCFENIIDVKDESLHKLFVDIFIIDNVPDNPVHRFLKGRACEALHFIAGQVYVYECRDADMKKYFLAVGRSYYYARMLIGFLFSFRKSSRWFDSIDRLSRHDNEKSAFVGAVTGRWHYFGELIERDTCFPYSTGTFEGEEVLLHHRVDRYLTKMYGDYAKLPPPEDRERHFIYRMKL